LIRLTGCLLVMCGGFMGMFLQVRERRRRAEALRSVTEALRRATEEIRMRRTPLPRLMERLSASVGGEVGRCFAEMSAGIQKGDSPEVVWQMEVERLPLLTEDKNSLRELEWQGDEEKICNGILLAIQRLTRSEEVQRQSAPQETKRSAALWVSGAALLMILLI